MEPKPTRNIAVLAMEQVVPLSSMLKTDVLKEPNTQKRMLKVKAVSAAKKEGSPDGVGVMVARFWLAESSEESSSVSFEFPVPEWWSAAQFLGALFVQTKKRKCWVIHCNCMDIGMPVQSPFVSISGANAALAWSAEEMDCNLRHNGGLAAVRGGRHP